MSVQSIPDAPPHVRTSLEVVADLDTNADVGLTAFEAKERRSRFGPNLLQVEQRSSGLQRFLAQFRDPQVYLLLAAAVVSAIVSALEHAGISYEALIILAIVVLNAVLGFVQEDRAERALASLQAMAPIEATVLRDGSQQRILAEDVVPGDLLVVREGDLIPADARLIQTTGFHTLEAPLTGESLPTAKHTAPVEHSAGIADRTNTIFAGTTAISGHAQAVVTSTGMQTEFGKIAALVHSAESPVTPLQKDLGRLSKQLSAAVVGIAAVVVPTLLYLNGVHTPKAIMDVLLFGIALAVAATPEGLAAIITLVLAIGVQRMARRGAIIRKLPAVETLGSTTVIASDKTGTMTRNEMTVQVTVTHSGRVAISGTGYSPDGDFTTTQGGTVPEEQWAEVHLLLQAATLVNNAQLSRHANLWTIQGDPTEAALLTAASKAKIASAELVSQYPRVAEVVFSSERKMMSTVHRKTQHGHDEHIVFTKGAPDVLLDHCTHEFVAGLTHPLTPLRRTEILRENEHLTDEALRTLGIATRTLPLDQTFDPTDMDDQAIERDLTFIGLVGMMDPPRPEARLAVEQARTAGIRTIMITGDHPRTAVAIARVLGIISDNHFLSGTQLDQISDSDLVQAVQNTGVYARVNPEHKLRIVRALQQNHQIVAMTGDGVNDAPALKAAQIGIAMGITGTDVSKGAADLILTDDNFATIVAAVEEGRVIFDNIRKFLRYLLSTNAGEVLTIFLGAVLMTRKGTGFNHSLLLPLSAAQILWINLITDGAPALALGVDASSPNIMQRPPRPIGERVIDRRMITNIAIMAITMAIGTLWVFFTASPNSPDQHSQSLAFNTLILFQLFNSLSARSDSRSILQGIFSNRWLWAAILFSLSAQVILFAVPALRKAFEIVPLSYSEWLYCALIASSVLVVNEVEKLFIRHALRNP
jgi:Ca2+-transporting ATPase